MNRKMRSKLNNSLAKEKRKDPKRKYSYSERDLCDSCGDPVSDHVLILVIDKLPKEKLH